MNDPTPHFYVDKSRASESPALHWAAIIFGLLGFAVGLRHSLADAVIGGFVNAVIAAFITWLIILVLRKAKKHRAR